MKTFALYISISLFLLQDTPDAPRIYLIRHAPVNIKKPSWADYERMLQYKKDYNTTSVIAFDKQPVLDKIGYDRKVDTVFCSRQIRSIQTARILFDSTVFIKTNEVLNEMEYPLIHIPKIALPANWWLVASRSYWMTGLNMDHKNQRLLRRQQLENFLKNIIKHAEVHGKTILVGHGITNREIIRTLKKQGWKYCKRDGYDNLSVNCLIKEIK